MDSIQPAPTTLAAHSFNEELILILWRRRESHFHCTIPRSLFFRALGCRIQTQCPSRNSLTIPEYVPSDMNLIKETSL